jgi:hypothetical protein
MSQRISVLSLEYLHVPLSIDVQGADFEIGFTEYEFRDIGPTTWYEAEYENGAARVLVGPDGGVELPVGVYMVWVRVTANPEIPVRQAGRIVIFGEEGS